MIKHEAELLEEIYGAAVGRSTAERLAKLLSEGSAKLTPPPSAGAARAACGPAADSGLPLDERDAVLITYGDQLREPGRAPLRTLATFAERYLDGAISSIHILPFFPSTSDDGFAVSDYESVDPGLGGWEEIEEIAAHRRLMTDLVLNHCSASHRWFRGFLSGDERFTDYFLSVAPGTDLSSVIRPRALPLLTPFETPSGTRHLWTTFSSDQIDLNYANPELLLEMIRVLFGYVRHGAQIVRLDAIAYLWKEIGHPSIHHPKTHAVVRLLRSLLTRYAPWVLLITETNVPHEENLSYLGEGDDEAQMVYQFALPPLVLDAVLREDAGHLRRWASGLPQGLASATYFNFLASHDGIGLLPVRNILTSDELSGVVEATKERGGLVSYRATPSGEVPYELNISYRDAVAEEGLPEQERARKFLASQAVLLSLLGVPGIYIHSLLGSGNWREGAESTGRNRSINREKLAYPALEAELRREGSLRRRIFDGYLRMLRVRQRPAFHPAGEQVVLPVEGPLFALLRRSPDGSDSVVCAINLSSRPQSIVVDPAFREELIDGGTLEGRIERGGRRLSLAPWQVAWLAAARSRPS